MPPNVTVILFFLCFVLLLGVFSVRQDRTATVNGYVYPTDDGIASACGRKDYENTYRVVRVINENVCEIVIK